MGRVTVTVLSEDFKQLRVTSDIFKAVAKHHRLTSVENFGFVIETWSFLFGLKA
jgi:hypothetical protein